VLEVYTTEEVLRLKIPVTELSEVELLREIHLLEEQDEVLWTAWSQTVKPIADNEVVTPVPVPGNVILWEKWKQNRESAAALWDAFGTLKHGISRGDIVVCRGVCFLVKRFQNGHDKTSSPLEYVVWKDETTTRFIYKTEMKYALYNG
jgi:hypothetical protein